MPSNEAPTMNEGPTKTDSRLAWLLVLVPLLVLLAWWALHGRPPWVQAPSSDGGSADEDPGSPSMTRAVGDAGARAAATGVDAGLEASAPRFVLHLSEATVRRDPTAGAGELAGIVVGRASGRPVAGAELTFAHGGAARTVRAGPEGRFLFSPDAEGSYVLALVTADGFLPYAPEWGYSPIRFEARRGARVEGVRVTLVDALVTVVEVTADGQPVQGAHVRVLGVERGERALAPMRATYRTDAAGEARVLAPDGVVIEASHEAHGSGRARVNTPAQVIHRVSIRLSRELAEGLEGDRRIAGRVIGPDDDPVEGALVTALAIVPRASEESALHPPLAAVSGANGRFVLEGADSCAYRLIATAEGLERTSAAPVLASSEETVLRMRAEGRLLVAAVDEAGSPVAALSVIVQRRVGALERETLAVASGYDADGELEVGGLPEGPVLVTATSPGFAPSDAIPARAERSPTRLEIPLSRGARITGRVISAGDGRALEGARVTLEGGPGSGSSAVPLESSALTGADGRFELTGVPAGVGSLVVWAGEHHGRVRSGLAIERGGRLDVGTLDLTPLGEGETPQIELAGIGAVLSAEGDAMVIGRVIEGGGAAEVGLGPGDAIVAIDGAGVGGLGFAGCIERIRGPEGTVVRLTVRRAGRDSLETLDVPRRRIRA